MNQRRTAIARSSSVLPAAIAANSSGRSFQYAADRAFSTPAGFMHERTRRTRELGERDGGEDERRRGQGREIARDGREPVCARRCRQQRLLVFAV
jgi:hypothetical protein